MPGGDFIAAQQNISLVALGVISSYMLSELHQ
jgi:hypothetical protein